MPPCLPHHRPGALVLCLGTLAASCAIGAVDEPSVSSPTTSSAAPSASDPTSGQPQSEVTAAGSDQSENDGGTMPPPNTDASAACDPSDDCGCDPEDTDGDGVPDCDDQCPTDPGADTLGSWYPDCDGDGEYGRQPVLACGTVDANRQSRCLGGQPPVGGWSALAGFDCDDMQASTGRATDWFPDCDGDGQPASEGVEACDSVQAEELVQCPQGGPALGEWSNSAGVDCDDGDAESAFACGLQDADGDGVCTPPTATPVSCLEILMGAPSSTDGRYTIDPDGAGGAQPFDVTCDMLNGGWTVVHEADFSQGDASGWRDDAGAAAAVDHTSQCAAAYGPMLGGLDRFGQDAAATQTFALLGVPHTEVALSLDYIVLDSWDGELGRVLLDGHEVHAESYDFRDGSVVQTCGGPWADHGAQSVSARVPHSSANLTVRVTSTLNQPAGDESFGVNNIRLRIR